MNRGPELYETRQRVRTCTNIAGDPVVSGENRRFGVFYCLHELVECCIEGRILLWSVEDDAALKRYVSEFTKAVSSMTVLTQTPPTCGLVLITKDVTIPCIPGERRSACTILMGSMTYEVVPSTLFFQLWLNDGSVSVIA